MGLGKRCGMRSESSHGEFPQVYGAGPDDLATTLSIVRRSIVAMRSAGVDQWDDHYPDESTLADDIAAESLFLIRCEEQPVGLIVLNEHQEPEYGTVSWRLGGRVMVVHRLVIDPEFQRRGLATELMRFAEEWAIGVFDSIRLDAFAANPAAVSFYENLGYVRAGTVTFRKGEFVCFEKAVRHR